MLGVHCSVGGQDHLVPGGALADEQDMGEATCQVEEQPKGCLYDQRAIIPSEDHIKAHLNLHCNQTIGFPSCWQCCTCSCFLQSYKVGPQTAPPRRLQVSHLVPSSGG